MHLAKINWHDMQKNIDTASNEVLAKVPRLNLGSQVVLGNKKLTGDRRQMTENMVNLSLEKLSVNMLMLLYQTFSLLTAKS